MIDGWQSWSPLQKVAIGLALVGLLYLLLQTRTSPIQVSTWNGGGLSVVNAGVETTDRGISGVAQVQRAVAVDTPGGDPLGATRTVLTQGYGVGSHAPAAVWGGVDMAIDGDGDGQADPAGTLGAPIYATHSGVAKVRPDTWPAGNYISIENDHYKTAYAHLKEFAVADGQQVEAGQIIGYVGSTGQASGPHLHYEVWVDGQNVNPLDYDAIEGAK